MWKPQENLFVPKTHSPCLFDTGHSFISGLMVSARLVTFTLVFFLDTGHSIISGLGESARLVALTVRSSNQQMAALPVVDSKHMSPFLFANKEEEDRKSEFMLAQQAVNGHLSLSSFLCFFRRGFLCKQSLLSWNFYD